MTSAHRRYVCRYIRCVPAPVSPASNPGLLVDRVAAGDRVAFAALYDLLAPYLWARAQAATTDTWEARKLTASVFEDVWTRAPHLASGSDCPLARVLATAHDAIREAAASPTPQTEP